MWAGEAVTGRSSPSASEEARGALSSEQGGGGASKMRERWEELASSRQLAAAATAVNGCRWGPEAVAMALGLWQEFRRNAAQNGRQVESVQQALSVGEADVNGPCVLIKILAVCLRRKRCRWQ